MPQITPANIRPGMVVAMGESAPHLVVTTMQTYYTSGPNDIILLDKAGDIVRLNNRQKTIPPVFEHIPERPPAEFRTALLGKPDTLANSIATTGGAEWLSIGTDPEIFAVDEAGRVIPAFAYLGPKPNGVATAQFYDGFQAEWTTMATVCLGQQLDNVRAGMQAVRAAAKNLTASARLTSASVVDIEFDPNIPPERYQLGCSPSLNAYNEASPLTGTPELLPFRSAGWHMHWCRMGYKTDPIGSPIQSPFEIDKDLAAKIIRLEDRILGVSLTSFGEGHHDRRRRLLYGRAGEYRLGKTLEYRTPEVLMGCHPAVWNLFWDLGRAVYWLAVKGFDFIWDSDDEETREAINQSDVPLARKILARNLPVLKAILHSAYRTDPIATEQGVRTIMTGVDAVVAEPDNIENNWWLSPTRHWPIERQGHATGTIWSSASILLAQGGKI